MKPERLLQIAPVVVSQETSLQVLGLPPRRFREWVRARRVPHSRVGQLVLVELPVALEALRAERSEADHEPADELAELRALAGLRKVAG